MRRPAVADKFYPGDRKKLENELKRCFLEVAQDVHALSTIKGAVVPHAGYVYSGSTAAEVYAVLPLAETFIFIGPNHTGYGSPVSVSLEDWNTPLGTVRVDTEFIDSLPGIIIDHDNTAHMYEHSIEVQLPFLQYRFKEDFRIVSICLQLQDEETASDVAAELMEAIRKTGRKTIIIASSDFTHFEPDAVARKIDDYVIQPILGMDVERFYRNLQEKNATVCGYGAIASMLNTVKGLGAWKGTLLKYATSGDVTGDLMDVVGYAGIILE